MKEIKNHIKTLEKMLVRILPVFFLSLCLFMSVSSYADSQGNETYYQILDSMQSKLSYALKYYANGVPGFSEYDREPETPLHTIKRARYTKGSDGIYRSSSLAKDGVATIMFTGDLMCQRGQQVEALNKYGCYDFSDNFAYVKSILSSSDFTIGNLETMLCETASFYSEEEKVEGRPQCNAPSTFLDAVRDAGFDMVATANNHNCDTGVEGIIKTLAHLDQYKLIHTGLFSSASEKRYQIVEIDGIKVAFLAYARYYNTKDQYLTEEGRSVMLNKYSKTKAAKDIKAAKKAGAEFTIVYIHWGEEFMNVESSTQDKQAKELADAGADYIIGSHPHALQPYKRITASDGRVVPVIYSMGNFVSHMTARDCSLDTIILKLQLKKNSQGKVVIKSEGYIPCRILKEYEGNFYSVLPLTDSYNAGHYAASAKGAYERITGILSARIKVLGKLSVNYLNISQSYQVTTYSGSAKNPTITVRDGSGNLLTKGTDYMIVREDNVEPGFSTYTVTGQGKYTGTYTGSFMIRPSKVTNLKLTRSSGKTVLSYSSVKYADGYIIYARKAGEEDYREIARSETAKAALPKIKEAGDYEISVTAYVDTEKGEVESKYASPVLLNVSGIR